MMINDNLKNWVGCMTSTNNILAVGSGDQMLSLFDVRTWKLFHSIQYQMDPYSLHLTPDLKYLTISGDKGEKCVTLQIN